MQSLYHQYIIAMKLCSGGNYKLNPLIMWSEFCLYKIIKVHPFYFNIILKLEVEQKILFIPICRI